MRDARPIRIGEEAFDISFRWDSIWFPQRSQIYRWEISDTSVTYQQWECLTGHTIHACSEPYFPKTWNSNRYNSNRGKLYFYLGDTVWHLSLLLLLSSIIKKTMDKYIHIFNISHIRHGNASLLKFLLFDSKKVLECVSIKSCLCWQKKQNKRENDRKQVWNVSTAKKLSKLVMTVYE